jgi:hypothetical protein
LLCGFRHDDEVLLRWGSVSGSDFYLIADPIFVIEVAVDVEKKFITFWTDSFFTSPLSPNWLPVKTTYKESIFFSVIAPTAYKRVKKKISIDL